MAQLGPARGVIAHSLGAAAVTFAVREGLHVERLVFIGAPADPLTWVERFGRRLGLSRAVMAEMRRQSETRIQARWEDLPLVPHEQGTYPMTESEVREAYLRIAASRIDLEQSLEHQVESEISLRQRARESFIAVPWYGSPNLIHPRHVAAFAHWMRTGLLANDIGDVLGYHLRVFSGGFRSVTGEDQNPTTAAHYLAVMKNGLIHLSANVLNGDDNRRLGAINLLARLVQVLAMVTELIDRAAYWGPWRLVHVLRLPDAFTLARFAFVEPFGELGQIPAGTYGNAVYEINPKQTGVALIAKELLDQVFQSAGIGECPWFGPHAEISAPLRTILERERNSAVARALLGPT